MTPIENSVHHKITFGLLKDILEDFYQSSKLLRQTGENILQIYYASGRYFCKDPITLPKTTLSTSDKTSFWMAFFNWSTHQVRFQLWGNLTFEHMRNISRNALSCTLLHTLQFSVIENSPPYRNIYWNSCKL